VCKNWWQRYSYSLPSRRVQAIPGRRKMGYERVPCAKKRVVQSCLRNPLSPMKDRPNHRCFVKIHVKW
jgi:hypothetical protein